MAAKVMSVSHWVIIGCWIIFLAYWLANFRRVKATVERQSPLAMAAHKLPLTLAGVLLWCPWPADFLHVALTPDTGWSHFAGATVCVLGLSIAIWSRRTLAGNWSSNATFKKGHELIKTGPYRFVRHPIYTGILLMCLGSAIKDGESHSWLAMVIFFLGFWIKLRQEESLMLEHFPGEYPAYRKSVKALVPFLI